MQGMITGLKGPYAFEGFWLLRACGFLGLIGPPSEMERHVFMRKSDGLIPKGHFRV